MLGVTDASDQRIDAATRRAQKIQRFQLARSINVELEGLKMQVCFPRGALCSPAACLSL